MGTAYSGGDVAAGPQVASDRGPDLAGGAPGDGTPPADGRQASGFGGAPADGGFGGPGGPGGTLDAAALDYLVANQGSARWIVAVSGANTAGQIELATGKAVMAMGGFSGSDATPTLDDLKAYLESGDLRYVLVGGGGGPAGPAGGSSDVTDWVTSTCAAVDLGTGTSSFYDCAAVAGG
jgi:hypothetical protein